MKDMFIKFISTIIVVAFLIVGCLKNNDPISVTSDFDTRLIGEWLFSDSLSMNYPAPPIAFSGIQITRDKNIRELGIETRTGKIDTLNYTRFQKLIEANDAVILVYIPWSGIDTMHYVIKEKELFVSDWYGERTYERTKLGSQVTDPLSFEFTTMIDSTNYEGLEVYSYPACFASRTSSTDLLITAFISYVNMRWIPFVEIRIEISDFHGVGTYQIPYAKGKLIYDEIDVIDMYLSDSTNIGTISITNYNEIENICTGTFSFDAINPESRKRLREGIFSLPLYK